jgi:hypothetical protein
VEVARTADIHITIGAAPSGQLSLENEIRLVKPALLYADHVTLYSPTTSMLAMTAAFGELSEDQKLEFLRQVAPTYDFLTHQGIVPAKWVLRESG